VSQLPLNRADDPEATARGLARLVAGDLATAWPGAGNEHEMPERNTVLQARYARWRTELDSAIRDLRP
jgi:hypothetical protein